MKKKFISNDGQEFCIGDVTTVIFHTPFGDVRTKAIEINDETIPILIKMGMLTEVPTAHSELNVDFCLKHLAERIKWNLENLNKYLNNLYTIYPAAVFSIILRELAIIMDEKYPDHINKSKEIWSISTLSGEIVRIKSLNKIKNFRNFAAFRTLEDALKAKKIMKRALEDLFNRNGK